MKAVLIPGDGIGKEISQSVVDITKAMNLDIEWVEYQAGAEYAAKTKEVFEQIGRASCRERVSSPV